MGSDVAVVSVSDGVVDNLPKAHPIVLSVDLGALAGIWMSRPRRLGGLSPTQMIAQIDATQGDVIAAALFGLAPALDDRGRTETRAALAILHAVTERLAKGAC
jgi:arginase family enzyme